MLLITFPLLLVFECEVVASLLEKVFSTLIQALATILGFALAALTLFLSKDWDSHFAILNQKIESTTGGNKDNWIAVKKKLTDAHNKTNEMFKEHMLVLIFLLLFYLCVYVLAIFAFRNTYSNYINSFVLSLGASTIIYSLLEMFSVVVILIKINRKSN